MTIIKFKKGKENKLEEISPIIPRLITLDESSLNRVVNDHDEKGYAIISACRQDLWMNDKDKIVATVNEDERKRFRKLDINSQEHIDANNIRTINLKNKIKDKYSFIPVFGGFKEEGQDKANIEKSFIVFPFNFKTKEDVDFEEFVNDICNWCVSSDNPKDDNPQDSVLIKFPNKNPRYYDPRNGLPTDDYEFVGLSLNDIIKMYFTAFKKWDDISQKDNFTNGSPQRWTLECYMNDFPKSIAEHRVRSNDGELVRFEKYAD